MIHLQDYIEQTQDQAANVRSGVSYLVLAHPDAPRVAAAAQVPILATCQSKSVELTSHSEKQQQIIKLV